jgi:V8-like Glu-specific endopeptidase
LIKAKSVLETRAQKGQIIHSVSTLPGHSGSPIILLADKNEDEICVVGIHTGGITTKIKGK